MKRALVVFVVLLVCLLSFLWFREDTLFTVGLNGFLYPGDDVKASLVNGDDITTYEAVVVTDSDDVILKRGEYFVDNGEKKTKVSIDLPLISEDGARLLILAQGEAVTDDFFVNTTFRGAVIADGGMYNLQTGEQVDRERYLFVKTKEGLFVNTFDITIQTLTKNKRIPANSLILFEKDELRFYSFDSNNVEYDFDKLDGINSSDSVNIAGKEFTYETIISGLGVWKDDDEEELLEGDMSEEDEQNGMKEEESGDKDEQLSSYSLPEDLNEKMEIAGRFVKADTYAATFDFYIYDPKEEMTKYPTVVISVGDEVYMRKTFYASAESEIVGLMPNTKYNFIITYIYKNEKGNLIQVVLDEGEFNTDGLDGVEPVLIAYDQIEVGANDAKINGLALGNNSEDKVLRGLNKIELIINGREIKIGASVVSALRRLESLRYTVPVALDSNTFYHLELKAYDLAGNVLKIEDAEFDFKTSKAAPSIKVLREDSDYTWFEVGLSMNNPDDVNIENLRYVILDGVQIVANGRMNSDMIIRRDNLDEGRIYRLLVYADYDLDDGEGNRRDQTMLDVDIATVSIAKLGNLYMTLNKEKIDKNSAEFKVKINNRSTSANLINLLDVLSFQLNDADGNTIKTLEMDEDEMDILKQRGNIILRFDGLIPDKEYSMEASGMLKQGGMEYPVSVYLSMKGFRTFKNPASADIRSMFVDASMIDFEARVIDDDKSILSDYVLMEIRNSNRVLVAMETLDINADYGRFSYNKLENGEYTISFIAERYNEGHSDMTAESNKKIVEDIKITVGDNISGSVMLKSLLRQVDGKNYFDIENARRWKSSGNSIVDNREYMSEENAVVLSARNGWRTYAYYIPELAGESVTVSFDAKLLSVGSGKALGVLNGDGSGRTCSVNASEDKYNESRFKCEFKLNSTGYVGFYLEEVSGANETLAVALKDLQVEMVKTGEATGVFEPYKGKDRVEGKYTATMRVDLADKMHIVSNYCLKYYRFDNYVDERCENISQSESIIELEMNSDYDVRLVVKVGEKEYEIASTEFTTEDEIRSIRSIDDFSKMHVNGKYLVMNDLDFRSVRYPLISNFYGSLDFQGHKMLMDTDGAPNELITSYYGVFKNADIHLYINNVSGRDYFYGVTQNNYGTIENVMVTVEESVPDLKNSQLTTLVRYNYGIINNFVVHLKAPIYGIKYLSALCLSNQNTIRDGYVYGDDGIAIEALYDDGGTNPKRIGAIAAEQGTSGRLENVFSLLDINVHTESEGEKWGVGNLLGLAQDGSTITHAFSNAGGRNRASSYDINWIPASGYQSQNFTIEKLYYVSESVYGNNGSTRISLLALRDVGFENDILNSRGAFKVENFVKYGYYPQVILPDIMPNQDYLPLPVTGETGIVDIIAVKSVDRRSDDSAEVVLRLDNPYEYTINNIRITNFSNANNDNVRIEEQIHEDGITELRLLLENPDYYYSSYSVRSIEYSTPYGSIATREYTTNEKVINAEMYKSINNINDWNNVNTKDSNKNQNYILRTDLDFFGNGTKFAETFRGQLDGNGHVIKNINSDDSVIVNLYGTVKNLNVENYINTNKVNNSAGLVASAYSGAQIKNVHMKKVSLASNNYIGGLVGYIYSAIVQDSSVAEVSLSSDRIGTSGQIRVGGLVGYMSGSSIVRNSFASEVNFDVTQNSNIYAIGGLVGQVSTGTIENVYSTGNMTTITPNNGGIVGLASGRGVLNKAYSDTNIYTASGINIGGIVGGVDSPTSYSVSNTLSVGSIYTSLKDGSVRRTLGGELIVSQPNYAWSGQHLNGQSSNNTSGEILLNTDELKSRETYKNIISMGEWFSYDGVSDGSLPLLQYSDRSTILPNQEKNYLKTYELSIKSAEVSQENATVGLTIDNQIGADIVGIEIDYADADVLVNRNENGRGETYYEVKIEPSKNDGRYYDSYRLSKIKYKVGGREYEIDCDYKINIQFFKRLVTPKDWVNMNMLENYYVEADLDFGSLCDNANPDNCTDDGKYKKAENRVRINRLEGNKKDGTTPVIKNIIIEDNDDEVGLIHTIGNSLKKISFENITIKNNSSDIKNKMGMILYEYGNTEDVSFNNIQIFGKANHVGMVADNLSNSIKNINVNNSSVKGHTYVGGYSGTISANAVNEVKIENTNVVGSNGFTGGFAGQQTYPTYVLQFGINVENTIVDGNGNNYVGGIYGYGIGSGLKVKNVEVSGKDYVGGITGYSNAGQGLSNLTAECIKVVGNGYVGGIAGQNYTYAGGVIVSGSTKGEDAGGKEIDVECDAKYRGINVSGTAWYVGGAYGRSDQTIVSPIVKDINVSSSSGGVGGVTGGVGTVQYGMVYNVTVSGKSDVGGIIGYIGSVQYSTVNRSFISATDHSVGGAVGSNPSGYAQFYVEIIDSDIIGKSKVGGVVGRVGDENNDTKEAGHSGDNSNNRISQCTVNARIRATDSDAGGIVGYVNDNEWSTIVNGEEKQYRVRKIYGNIVESSTISAKNNAGGLVGRLKGKIKEEIGGNGNTVYVYDKHIYSNRIYQNLVVANVAVDEQADIADARIGVFIGDGDNYIYDNNGALNAYFQEKEGEPKISNMRVYSGTKMQIGNIIKSVGDADYNWNGFRSDGIFKVGLEALKGQSIYENGGISLEYSKMDGKYYPFIKNDYMKTRYTSYRSMVELPVEVSNPNVEQLSENGGSRNTSAGYHILPKYRIYPSDVDKLNVEFDSVDTNTTFSINNVEHIVDNRVFSFNYNYNTNVVFSMTDGINSEEMVYEPGDLRGHFATIGDKYYILKGDGSVITNDDRLIEKKVVNIFKNKLLAEDGEIISIEGGDVIHDNVSEFASVEAIPLYQFDRQGLQIETFAGFSLIEGLNAINKQVLYKGTQTELVADSFENIKWQGVMDSYNNKDYLTILGSDGVIYDLKNRLSYPDNFDNSGIVEISNNILNQTYLMAVRYENGSVIVFNYRNGALVYRLQPEVIVTPLEYLAQEITGSSESNYDNEIIQISLLNTENLIKEIKNGVVVSNETELSVASEYITSFDPIKNEYEIYEIDDLSKVDPLGVMRVSVSDQIYGDNTLNVLFGHYLSNNIGSDGKSAMIVYAGITVLIASSMVALGGLLRKKHGHF